MRNPEEVWKNLKGKIKSEWKVAFLATFLLGVLVHMPIMLSDIPNHDGLDSMYFDQNMITSGRWFLTVACGFSSYFTLPWLIGLLGIVFLAVASVAVTEILELRSRAVIALTGGILVAFPALASTFAYVFTLDGYMMGLLFAVLAVLVTKKYKKGFLGGAVLLAFSMGVYQAYLPFAILLSVYAILMHFLEEHSFREKVKNVCSYLGMGVLGAVLYYVILRVLLLIQGKELASYQGISDMGNVAGLDLVSTFKTIFGDFVVFTLKGHVVFNNAFSAAAVILLAVFVIVTLIKIMFGKKLWKSPWFYVVLAALCVILPVGTSIILIISRGVTYHLLMRYQWVLFVICALGFVDRYTKAEDKHFALTNWVSIFVAVILFFNYAVIDNIAYSNLEKRYEKTYAYCLRLLDRMEQTEGYYKGIPVAMIGVVSDHQYPVTDITEEVTGSLVGVPGDSLLYTADNYQDFFKYYLGVEINPIDIEDMPAIYDSPEYIEMDSFPGENSVRVVDGILYIKTENMH